jgi:hypothetical protein
MLFRPFIRYFPRFSPISKIKLQVRAKVSNPNRLGCFLFTKFSDPRTYSCRSQYIALLFYVCSPVGVLDEGVSQRRTRLAVVQNVRVTLVKPRADSLKVSRLVTGFSLHTNNMFSGGSMPACLISSNHLKLFRSASRCARLRIPAHYSTTHRLTLSGRRRRLDAAAGLNALLVSRVIVHRSSMRSCDAVGGTEPLENKISSILVASQRPRC